MPEVLKISEAINAKSCAGTFSLLLQAKGQHVVKIYRTAKVYLLRDFFALKFCLYPQFLRNFQKQHADMHHAKFKQPFTSEGHMLNTIDNTVNIYHCAASDVPFQEWIAPPSDPGFLPVQMSREKRQKLI